MKLFKLVQKKHYDFTMPDMVNCMIIRAETEAKARLLANNNEQEHRGGQDWSDKNANIEILETSGKEEVIITS